VPRLFVAVVPPDAVLEQVAALPRPDVEGLRWTMRDQWHVTLRFLGRVDDAEATAAADALARAPLPRCEATLGPELGRFGRRVLHVPVAGLDELAAAVLGATAGLGAPPEDRPFRGHVTLARARSRRGVDLRPLTRDAIAGAWPVEEVVLMESHMNPKGARYERMATVRTMDT
jgi:2'-5' RNA ligase